jgi:hypothetical protein
VFSEVGSGAGGSASGFVFRSGLTHTALAGGWPGRYSVFLSRMNKIFTLFTILLLPLLVACNGVMSDSASNQVCPNDFSAILIDQLRQKPKQNPAAEVTQYTYQGRTVYLVTGGCCDAYNYLFDTCGNVLCAASGGLSGKGDGACPDFLTTATNPILLWRDPR